MSYILQGGEWGYNTICDIKAGYHVNGRYELYHILSNWHRNFTKTLDSSDVNMHHSLWDIICILHGMVSHYNFGQMTTKCSDLQGQIEVKVCIKCHVHF